MRKFATGVAFGVLVFGVTACTGGDLPSAKSGKEAAVLLKQAAKNTAGFDGAYRAHLHGKQGTTAFDIRSHYDASEKLGSFTLSSGGLKVKLLVRHKRVWARFHGQAFGFDLPKGKHWVTASAEKFKQLRLATKAKKNQAQLYLVLAAKGVEATGTDTVADDSVRTYDFHTTKRKALQAVRKEGHKAVSQVLLVGGPDTKITGKVAVDGDERIRRFRFVSHSDTRARVTGTYTDFGEPVSVEPPPTKSVVTLAQVRAGRAQNQ